MKKYSIVIPVYNEEKSVGPLYEEIVKNFNSITKKEKSTYEVIYVDDGSTDQTPKELLKLKTKPNVTVITLRRNFGKAAALSHGFEKSSGDIVFTMDGDLQDDPADAIEFIKKINEGYDVVSGWKVDRNDPADKTIPSKVFNFMVSHLSGLKLHDINSGFKAYKKGVIENITIYSQLYRFIPLMASEKGYSVTEIPINNRKRKYGVSKYNWKRILIGLMDLLTILFITKFAKRPMHFFAPIGFFSLMVGVFAFIYLVIQHFAGHSISDRPLYIFSILLILVGFQIIFTGLLAELITSFNHKNSYYPIKEDNET